MKGGSPTGTYKPEMPSFEMPSIADCVTVPRDGSGFVGAEGPVVGAPDRVSPCLLCAPKTGCAPGPAAGADLHARPVFSGLDPDTWCQREVTSQTRGPTGAGWGLFPPVSPHPASSCPDGTDTAAPPLPPLSVLGSRGRGSWALLTAGSPVGSQPLDPTWVLGTPTHGLWGMGSSPEVVTLNAHRHICKNPTGRQHADHLSC